MGDLRIRLNNFIDFYGSKISFIAKESNITYKTLVRFKSGARNMKQIDQNKLIEFLNSRERDNECNYTARET